MQLGNLNSVLVKAEDRIFLWVFFYKHVKKISTEGVFGLFGGEKEKGCSSADRLRQLKRTWEGNLQLLFLWDSVEGLTFQGFTALI